MADNSIGRSFQRILFWNNFVTEKLNTESTECPEVKEEEEEEVEDEQCCIDLSSPWISCGAVAAGEPLTDPLSLEGGDRASGEAVAAAGGAVEVSSGALAAVKHLADTLIPRRRQEAKQEILSTTGTVEQADNSQADHSLDYNSPLSARLRHTASSTNSASRGQCSELPGSDSEPDVQSGECVKEKRYFCATCGKGFGRLRYLGRHMHTHKNPRPYTCDSCDTVFQTYSEFFFHPCVRTLCKRTFRSKECLMRHLRVHGDRPFVCAACGLAFRTQFNLNLHARTHTRNSPGAQEGSRADCATFVCSVCGLSFSVKARLTYHERRTCMLGVYSPPRKLCRNGNKKLADTRLYER